MADSIQDWQWLILAVIGVIGGLGSYIVNAKLQRGLERNKIQYDAKNRAFRDLTEAGRKLMSTTEAFRALANGLNDPGMDTVETIMTGAVLAQDLERPLGGSLSANILTRLKESFEIVPKNMEAPATHKDESYRVEIAGAVNSLHLLYTLLFTYYHERLVISSENAFIVMEEFDEFRNAVSKFAEYVEKSFHEQRKRFATFHENMERGTEPTTSADYVMDQNLRKMWGSLLKEMNENLYQTL